MTFQLDTTGFVANVPGPGETARSVSIRGGQTVWSDLTPFAQGYVEPVLRTVGAAFWQLAPETLARIIADCDEVELHHFGLGQDDRGAKFWERRQRGDFTRFPPLTVSLNDAGKVVFG